MLFSALFREDQKTPFCLVSTKSVNKSKNSPLKNLFFAGLSGSVDNDAQSILGILAASAVDCGISRQIRMNVRILFMIDAYL